MVTELRSVEGTYQLKKMNSQASDHASSSSMGGSGGAVTVLQEFLPMEEHLENFKRNFSKCFGGYEFDSSESKDVSEMVENLRKDPVAACDGILYYREKIHSYFRRYLKNATSLHWAVLMDDRAMVQCTVNVNAWAGYRWEYTALHLAIECENVDMVKNLHEHGATVENGDARFRWDHLPYLVSNDVIFNMIFEQLPDTDIRYRDGCGQTVFHCAAWVGAIHVLEYLLVERKIDIINLLDDKGRTALHLAIEKKEMGVVEYLVEHKADVHVTDNHGASPLLYSIECGNIDIFTYMFAKDENVHIQDEEGNNALHYAVRAYDKGQGNIGIVKRLLELDVDMNATNKQGYSPFFVALKGVHTELVEEMLLSKERVKTMQKSDKNEQIVDTDGNNALHYAVQTYDKKQGNIDIVKRLRELDVDMNATNKRGYSPFFAAVLGGHTEVVKELLRSKERVKIMEECHGKTPIQIAYDNDFEHIKRALLECDDVSRYMETFYRDRQVYVDAANAILVGAALIASVTFASWLQPPLGYTTYSGESYASPIPAPSSSDLSYVDVQHNVPLRAFWVLNCLSFYFAIATVVFGARSVLPRSQLFIKETVEKLRINLLVTSILLAFAVAFVIVAFGIAGCIVLTPMLKFQWYMMVPTIFGGIVCLVSLAFFFRSMLEDNLRKKRDSESVYWFNRKKDWLNWLNG